MLKHMPTQIRAAARKSEMDDAIAGIEDYAMSAASRCVQELNQLFNTAIDARQSARDAGDDIAASRADALAGSLATLINELAEFVD